ncbi:MAG: hypothetical protein RLZZ422_575 [Pseudomonadota bacterium]
MILNTKTLTPSQLEIINLLLSGALAPQMGFSSRADVLSVQQYSRLTNGQLAALPLALPLTPAEKQTAQLSGRIALTDSDDRVIAEVQVTELYRLPSEALEAVKFFEPNITSDYWFAAGSIQAVKPILHARFKSSRASVKDLKHYFKNQRWQHIVAVQAKPTLNTVDAQHACEWLFANHRGGLLIQTVADESSEYFSEQVHAVRDQIRCSAARAVKLTLLPVIHHLSTQQEALLHAIICRNSGVTALVINADTPASTKQWLQRHRDELDLELLIAKRSTQRATHQQPQFAALQQVA